MPSHEARPFVDDFTEQELTNRARMFVIAIGVSAAAWAVLGLGTAHVLPNDFELSAPDAIAVLQP